MAGGWWESGDRKPEKRSAEKIETVELYWSFPEGIPNYSRIIHLFCTC